MIFSICLTLPYSNDHIIQLFNLTYNILAKDFSEIIDFDDFGAIQVLVLDISIKILLQLFDYLF